MKNDTVLLRHPARDGELYKMPLDKIRNLAVQMYFVIENPTPRLAKIFTDTHFSHKVTDWVDAYKLARFEKMKEIERKGE